MTRVPLPTQDGSRESPRLAKFTVVEGQAKGRRYKVDDAATIGRSPEATIMLEDPEISRLHAKVARTNDGRFEVVDLDSRNGTYLNGERVRRAVLSYGDRLRLGPATVLEFYAFDANEEHIIQRQRFESIGRLSVGIAHDLNNVLATLDAGTSFLVNLPPHTQTGEAEVRECLSDMALAASRAAELTRAILSFVRGRGHAHCTIDLSALLRELSRMLRRTLDRRISLNLDVEDGVLVHGSQSELHQVLLNLCLNARDAMPTGGQLTLSAHIVTKPGSNASRDPETAIALVAVSDSGHGMDEATASRIFEPFFTTKQTGHGYGLGLATVREIVTIHGGQVKVDSTVGSGTRFSLYLPALVPTPSESIPTALTSPPLTLRPTAVQSILVVDDEDIVRRALSRRLRQVGFVVFEASNGKEAVRLYREHQDDLVVLDLDMPDLDGEQTHIQLMRANPDVRVTYLTGYVDPPREQRLRRLGALAVLEKPCSIDDLLALLRARPVELPDNESSDDTTRTYGIDQFGPNSSKNPGIPDG